VPAIGGTVHLYNRAVELLTQYAYDFDTLLVTASLHTSAYTPNAAHAYDADLTGEAPALGNYVRKPLQGREVVYDEAVGRFQFNAARVTWPRSTIRARYAVLRFDGRTPSLLAFVDFGQNLQTTNALLELTWNNDRVFELQGVPSG
jgi:hypothetical protein